MDCLQAGELKCLGKLQSLSDAGAFAQWLEPMRKQDWVVYAKRPFAGPEAVLAYLSRYTHRVAISNSRLLALGEKGVTFKWKDYRQEGKACQKTMTLDTDEFIRRFLTHVLPRGLHRIRHYGLFANARRNNNLTTARQLLKVQAQPASTDENKAGDKVPDNPYVCPACSAPMIIIETLLPGQQPRAPPEQEAA